MPGPLARARVRPLAHLLRALAGAAPEPLLREERLVPPNYTDPIDVYENVVHGT